jgi:hypothetical protein
MPARNFSPEYPKLLREKNPKTFNSENPKPDMTPNLGNSETRCPKTPEPLRWLKSQNPEKISALPPKQSNK